MLDERFDHTVPEFNSKCNIVFLDIDGVLCNARSSLACGDYGVLSYLDPVACKLVKRLCIVNNARLVISSSWRLLTDRYSMQAILNASCAGLGNLMLMNEPDHIWNTPSFTDAARYGRGNEIEEWVRRNPTKFNQFVVLDDDSDWGNLEQFWVKTDTYDGLGFRDYLKAEAILKGEEPPKL